MVKKIATLLLFAALIIFAFIQYFYIRDSSKEFSDLGEKASGYAIKDDMRNAFITIKELNDKWMDKENSFEALMEHSETDKISMSMEKALSFASQNDRIQFLAEVSVLKFLLEHIHEVDSLSWENIL